MHRFILVVLAILVVAAPAPAEVERAIAVPPGDIAGATALRLLASFEASRDTTVDPSMADRRELHDQLATLGMFVLAVRAEVARKPDPTVVQNLRFAAEVGAGRSRRGDPSR
jgi:hypothetical protein